MSDRPDEKAAPEHLFRRESAKMIAALTRALGTERLALAEDAVQDALCRALETWTYRGVPENPAAWLMTAAKNRALDLVRREKTVRAFAPELTRSIEDAHDLGPALEELASDEGIEDDELRMMFSCCDPRLPEDAQVALVFNLLSGLSTSEIAQAFLASDAAIEKRIGRAKKVLASSSRLFELARGDDFSARLVAVERALYLLFNEGYHGASKEGAVRPLLCEEAMRFVGMLLKHPLARTPRTYALAASMCMHAARLPARVDASGELTSLLEQDRARWDQALAREGEALLERSATGDEISAYHVEAAIASVHARATSADATDWTQIVSLYDLLMTIAPSPVVALARAIAIGQGEGAERGLGAIAAIEGVEVLAKYPFYEAALGDLEERAGRPDVAREHFERAASQARSDIERRFFARRARAAIESR